MTAAQRALWDSARYNLVPDAMEELATELHRRVMRSPDAAEGVRDFLERRPPRRSGRVHEESRKPSGSGIRWLDRRTMQR
ncbi:hypothetical protein [Nocardia sp. IFM 10818]